MSSIAPQDEAAAIFAHYFAQLAKAAGLRWSERYTDDIARACELLINPEEALDELLPYERPIYPDRQTLVLDRARRWKSERLRA